MTQDPPDLEGQKARIAGKVGFGTLVLLAGLLAVFGSMSRDHQIKHALS